MSELSPEGQNEDLSNLSKEQLRPEFDSSRQRLQNLWENAQTLHPDQRDNTRLVFDKELEWYRKISVQLAKLDNFVSEGQNEELKSLNKEQLQSRLDSSQQKLRNLWENAQTLHSDQKDNTRLVFDNELELYRRISIQLAKMVSTQSDDGLGALLVIIIAVLYMLSQLN